MLLTGILTGCTSVRPIVKIGLIAPFEGLYRESGYAALEGMRQAMTDCTPPGMDVLPLALDDSGDPAQAQRAAQKLLVDPSVRAVVGPLLLSAVPAVSVVMSRTTAPAWYIPPLVAPTSNFTAPSSSAWLTAQVDFVAAATSAERVLLLGLPHEWELVVNAAVPALRMDDLDAALATVESDDAILWLGQPDAGARWFDAIRQAHPTVEFWLAAQAGMDVFAAHSQDPHATYWLYWARPDYAQSLQPDDNAIQPTDAMRDLAYHASCAALDAMHAQPPVTADWKLLGRTVRAPDAANAR